MGASTEEEALALVHRGWDHLKQQRPLAAWASWQRALRVRPDDPAALQALELLAGADDLPAAARVVYRFRNPAGPGARARWDDRLRDRGLDDPAEAAEVFKALAEADPADAPARFNQALCLAWEGDNLGAIGSLARSLAIDADSGDEEAAASAWALAEVLRQGAGAEALADDLTHALIFLWDEDDGKPVALAPLVPIPTPPGDDDTRAFEWLDREPPAPRPGLEVSDLPRVLAGVIRTPGSLRLASPDPLGLIEAQARLGRRPGGEGRPALRASRPLALALLDAGAWTVRIPPGLDLEDRRRLARAALEAYYEDRWIHAPRQGLDGRTPVEASRAVAEGDRVARAQLAGIVRLREQLGARTRTAVLYGGYPFDRLRRRLGLEPVDPDAIDPGDLACMSGAGLDRLDPGDLDDASLASAFGSAAGLGDDARTARFAAELAGRGPFGARPALADLDVSRVFAVLLRDALARGEAGSALAWLDLALDAGGPGHRDTFDTWRAEVLVRTEAADEAVRVYEAVIDRRPDDARLALDAASSLLHGGHAPHARALALRALAIARSTGDVEGRASAEKFLDEIA